jgi:hypothetical protein
VIVSVDAEALAAAVLAEGQRHPARSPERRAAAVLWTALITTSSVSAARKALPSFAAPETVTAALELLGRLAAGKRP